MATTMMEDPSGDVFGFEDNSGDAAAMYFCRGMSMTMSMGGFQSALFSKGPADCITFLFTNWKLDHLGKFIGAMILTFLLAVVSEGIAHGQTYIRNYCLVGTPKLRRKIITTLLYGFQQLIGWILMLISMMFSIELFASVVVGLFVGKLLFPAELEIHELRNSNRTTRTATRRSSDSRDGGGDDDDDADININNDVLVQEESSAQSSSSGNGASGTSVRRRRH